MRTTYAATLALLLALTAACTSSDDEPDPPASPAPTADPTQEQSPSTTTTPTTSTSPTAPSSPAASGPVTPTTDLLDWQPVPGSIDDSVTTSGDHTLAVTADGVTATLDGKADKGAGKAGGRISDAYLDEDWAVVVRQAAQEGPAAKATVTDLASGKTFTLDGRSEPATVGGGTWALGEGHVLHATRDKFGAYCLASVDLASQVGSRRYCAPDRHGFNEARIGPGGDTFTGFDDKQPSCRTAYELTEDQAVPIDGITPCKVWEALLLGTPDDPQPVWSVVGKNNRIEIAHLYARTAAGTADLGPGTSGTLVACGDAAYFVRDPQREGDPARVLRWDGQSLTVVYESPSGQAFISEPRCGGSVLTVSAFAEGGDEQVSASVLP